MHRPPLDIGRRRFAVDGVAEHVEHARESSIAHRRFQRLARVLHRHAAGESLRGRQRNPAHVARVELGQHLDDNFPVLRMQQGMDGRQMRFEAYVDDAASHRGDHPDIR